MIINNLSNKEFKCTTTGKEYVGKFVERTGKFFYLDRLYSMKGFQGFRYLNKAQKIMLL